MSSTQIRQESHVAVVEEVSDVDVWEEVSEVLVSVVVWMLLQ